ncbi:MAG TPA: cyclic nucleotide-binding domain-containing protein [Anaerolineales bacterium]|nr:cyclic nucleotide-binding domain-containing protein [Anaerolineales bacterium]HNA55832.1 cyclic nucleotide-binding domain-containing protein [Anaerolineales bacterium]HNC90681.1 cyclic nucleotide-binding domain-containing protein [Anaerolineales bacterium]HND93353.1 cyclic nucleotide-binding domain-containing protein [Anaerolineales bacterium]HNF36300.1 cyclic nucleotide-binding domain-containing protein [Anaerolineales bacterium]
MIELKQRVMFLDKMHLFNGLKEEQLSGIGQKLTEREFSAGSVIFKRGDKPDGFYMVYKGRVKVTRPRDVGEDFLAWLAPGDYFGEEALFENRNRSATITAMENSTLLFLTREEFEKLLDRYDVLKPNFKVAIKSRKLARSTRFKWLGKNEVIYFIARRHKLKLYQALVYPVLALAIPAGLFGLGVLTAATTPYALATVALVGILGWGVWNAIDWSNDYYIVTNQRVIWLEKVIGLHDSREEAPLGTILSVGVETDAVGRVLDYGNVIVRTFVSRLEFDYVDHPNQAADMIREYWERTKAITTRSQMDVMKDTIKQKLGLPLDKRPQVELSPVVPEDQEKIAKTPYWILALSALFKLRVEEGATVIYRKHWIVYLQRGWRSLLTTLGVVFVFFARIWYFASSPTASFMKPNADGALRPDTLLLTIPVLMLPIGFWLWYEYTDWKNDIFKVTSDEIIDLDRKPFGKEERRSAQIESILSTSYKREGLIANIFNYGTVNISVGGNQLAFEDVIDPAGVQADINRRRSARIAKKNEDAGKDDRERFATWLAAYHQNINEFTAPVKVVKEDTASTNQFTKFNPPGMEDMAAEDNEQDMGGTDMAGGE